MVDCKKRKNMTIFIGGMYKSGTSLLRSMIGQHSAVFSGLETNWFKLSADEFSQISSLHHKTKISKFFDITEKKYKT